MGGELSGCTETTTNVFLEVALFDPIRVATTGRKLGILSDARYRFERGLDPQSAVWGVEVAARLARTGEEGQADIATQQTEFLVKGARIEMEDPAPNPTVLQHIARLTGGDYADLDDTEAVARVLEELPTASRTVRSARTRQLWNSPGLFFVFLALVSTEWVMRRRNQLV